MTSAPEWRAIDALPGYEVSSDGRVRGPKCVRKLRLNDRGYPVVSIRRKTYTVHTLVCRAFHGEKPSPAHEVRHLNGDSTDARAENLAWGTRSENSQDSLLHGTHGQAKKTHCIAGHPLSGDNLYLHPSKNGRECRECRRRRNRVYMRTYVPRQKRSVAS